MICTSLNFFSNLLGQIVEENSTSMYSTTYYLITEVVRIMCDTIVLVFLCDQLMESNF